MHACGLNGTYMNGIVDFSYFYYSKGSTIINPLRSRG